MDIPSLAYVVISPRRKARIGIHSGIVKFCLLHSGSDILSLGKDLKRCPVPTRTDEICAAIDRPIFIVFRSSLLAMGGEGISEYLPGSAAQASCRFVPAPRFNLPKVREQ